MSTIRRKPFRRVYAEPYLDLVNRAPEVLGCLYDYFDEPWKHERVRLHVITPGKPIQHTHIESFHGRNVDWMKWLTPTRRGGIHCPTE